MVTYTIKLKTNILPVTCETSSSDVCNPKAGGGCHDGSILKVKCCGQTLLTRQTLMRLAACLLTLQHLR